jgi:hypothetical protein
VLVLGFAAQVHGSPASTAENENLVLGPSAGAQLMEAFKKAGPDWHLQSAQISAKEINGEACLGPGTNRCTAFHLTHSDDSCGAVRAGPWCATIKEGVASAAELKLLIDALAGVSSDVWFDSRTTPMRAEREESLASRWPRAMTAVQLLLYFLVPTLLGLGLGRLCRRLRLPARIIAASVLVAGVVATFRIVPLGLWDLVLTGFILAGGYLWGSASRLRPAGLVFSGLILLVGCSVIELLVRRALPEPPRYPEAATARLLFAPEGREDVCRALRVEERPPWLNWRNGGVIRPGERVMHLGDSMVQGSGVEGNETFTAMLEQLDPEVVHINAGAVGCSVDAYLMVLRTWIDRANPTRVIVHLFTGNDMEEMDHPYSCCEAQPFFTYDGGIAQARCPTPRWRFTNAMIVGQAPAPYPLRALIRVSWAARHAVTTFARLADAISLQLAQTRPPDDEVTYAHIEAVLKALRDDLRARQIPLVISVLPFRGALESSRPKDSREWRIRGRFVSIAQKLDVPVLDAWDDFEALTRSEGSSRLFVTPPAWDVHFSPQGNRHYAEWLLRKLGPGLRNPPERTASE